MVFTSAVSGFAVTAEWGVYICRNDGALSLHCTFFCLDILLLDRCYPYSTDNGHNECTFKWVDVDGSEDYKRNQGKSSVDDKGREERSRLRLQDRELQEMSDGGWCLSMHQPWASLLVRGIKR